MKDWTLLYIVLALRPPSSTSTRHKIVYFLNPVTPQSNRFFEQQFDSCGFMRSSWYQTVRDDLLYDTQSTPIA
ncbi:Apolipoprotein C-IV [Frankliniella fusca]|uniref:Apolipoprotein C-IV n=1 Tax=Frankliniella fusca TaxID=407009 RepID=A0AAE1I298_9NEOP|nr:Apolipoprotein C-IV [Frankliniella fusca]